MAAKSTSYAQNLLQLIFNGTAFSLGNLAINATSTPLTNLFLSLHTAVPGAGNTATFAEAQYGSYARQPQTRTAAGFTVNTNSVVLASTAVFPQSSSGTETLVAFGVTTSLTGASPLLYFGSISPSVAVTGSGIQPELTTGTNISES